MDIAMKTFDLLTAMDELDDETVLSAREVPKKEISARRITRIALAAAAVAAVLSLNVIAFSIIRSDSVHLMESDPIGEGKQAVIIDERSAQVIEAQSVNYGISVTDNGTTVTLESLMGYSTDRDSLLYLTMTVTPPDGTALPQDISQYGFVDVVTSFPFDAADETAWDIPQGGGTTTAVKNPDGTVSVMLMRLFSAPVENAPMTLVLKDFDLCGKAGARARTAQEEQSENPLEKAAPAIEGTWKFSLGRLHLPKQEIRMLDKSALEQAGLPFQTVELTAFGGKITCEDTAPSVLERLRREYAAELKEQFPAVDWDHLSEEAFQKMLEEDMTTPPEEAADGLLLTDIVGWLEPWDYGCPTTFSLEYPDGTTYCVSSPLLIWQYVETSGEINFRILFPAPQPISQAAAIVIDSTRIPLQ